MHDRVCTAATKLTDGALVIVVADAIHDGDHMVGGWWVLGMGVVMLAVVIAVTVVALNSTGSRRADRPEDRAAVDPLFGARAVLARRYAEGDITTDEYRERIEQLG